MLIDVNAHVGRWPFLQYGPTDAAALEDNLRAAGITQAWVSAVESVLAPDPSLEEARLHRAIAGSDFFVHTPLISPMLFDWRDRLKQARDEYGSPFIRLMPTYHRYDTAGDDARAIANAAVEMGLGVALLMRIEDERAHYPLMKVPAPTVDAVAELAQAIAPAPLLLLAAYRWEIDPLAAQANMSFDLPYAEGPHPVRDLAQSLGADRMLYGSHAPFLYAAAQVRKLDFGELDNSALARVKSGNAQALTQAAASM